jgi:predicted  nucleic acid-binding Zn-ribbon protein
MDADGSRGGDPAGGAATTKEEGLMACMEHRCLSCGYVTFNNQARAPGGCPSCGGEMGHYFDEPEERDYERDDEARERRERDAAMRID